MFSFLSSKKESPKKTKRIKVVAIFLLVFMVFSFVLIQPEPVNAQALVFDSIGQAWKVGDTIWQKLTNTLKYLWQKGGSLAFQQVLRSSLNTIAYDTANYIGSGGEGQKPLFVTQDWGSYLEQIGDEAAGSFVENFANNLASSQDFVNEDTCQEDYEKCSSACIQAGKSCSDCTKTFNSCQEAVANRKAQYNSGNFGESSSSNELTGQLSPSFNVCQPSSIDSKVKITLGLVDQQRPQAPTCKATEIIKNWTDAKKLYHNNPNFLEDFKDIFDPRSNDLGIYWTARSDLAKEQIDQKDVSSKVLVGKGGWLDAQLISGETKSLPNQAELETQQKYESYSANFGKYTGDAFIDALNVFLNQLALSAFNNLMQNLGKNSAGGGNNQPIDLTKSESEVKFGESELKEITSKLQTPDFGVRTDYDILASLSICPNSQNPGPTNCVIDNKLMQGITEKKTVAEAIKEGYLYGDWQLTADTQPNTYSLRNITILRKYRILPVGWEMAIKKATANPDNLKKITLNDLVSCFSLTDQYNNFSSEFNTRDQGWCQGLVDPNWVLKAPLNYCKKQGIGAQILSEMTAPGQKGLVGSPDILSELKVVRAEEYCADEQTCIKEKSDGSCSAYGYCNEEKRTWNFGADSCEPIYNTCQTFSNSTNGQTVSYLKNTLNYENCDSEAAGCRQYSSFGAYATSTGIVSWNPGYSVYFNKNLNSCNGKDEGCTELMRVKASWGANLVMNADFGNDALLASSSVGVVAGNKAKLNDWPYFWSSGASGSLKKATIVDASQEPGGTSGKALKLEVASGSGQVIIGVYSDYDNPLVPKNLQTMPNQAYTLSADIYLVSGDHAYAVINEDGDETVATTTLKNSWQHLSVTRVAPNTYNEPQFHLHADNNSGGPVIFYVKNIKFEMSDWDTGYNPYGAAKIYEKILPPYLERSCYVDATSATKDYRFQDGAPSVCSNYARKCNRDEVGCEMYTAVKDKFPIPAKVTTTDYCPAECVNYDVYVSQETIFNSPNAENLIPKTARACNAEDNGCTEFTNLDELAQGGEQKEYYTYLKQCIKPTQGSCASFYAWEGTESGYQLKVYTLEKTAANEPKITNGTNENCDATIYNLPLSNPAYNPDCREFYNSAGAVSYHLASRTITCSDNCHAYRMTEKNIDSSLRSSTTCGDRGGQWDNTKNVCYLCLSNGVWDTNHQACVYQAIPGEGKTCSADQNACREYNGSRGSNERLAAYYDFESGKQGWYSNCTGGVAQSTISNNKNGHSLYFNFSAGNCSTIGEGVASTVKRLRIIEELIAADNPAAQLKVNNLVSQGNSYSLRFLARAQDEASLDIYFLNKDTGEIARFNKSGGTLTVKGGNEWGIYQANLENLDHQVGSNEILVITGTKSFYFDDLILTEITDRYYLIKNSSVIPDICYYDVFDNYQGADYNLGCAQYLDRGSQMNNLRQFSKLCSDSAVGCEQMIETKNYTPYGEGFWNDTNTNKVCDVDEPDCVRVPADSGVYVVYDANRQCNVADLGCSRLGQGQGSENSLVWSDVFKKNNPNSYEQILCGYSSLGCEEWRSPDNNELNYFKDPGYNTCLYRASQDPSSPGKAWYKVPVKRCDTNNNGQIDGTEKVTKICSNEAGCNGNPCIIDNNDYLCSTTYFKTIGFGGAGNQIPVPDQEAGLCDGNNSGCTEYLDPVSQHSVNLVYNPNYQIIDGRREGWIGALQNGTQEIKLEPNKIYIFGTESADGNNIGEVKLNFAPGTVKPLTIENTLGTSTASLLIPSNTPNQHLLFASLGNTKATLVGGNDSKTIIIREAIVDYQLANNVDKTSCNGLVKFDNGCILFNERSVNGSQGLADLSQSWSAYATVDGQAPAVCDSGIIDSCNANQLIKVRPNRVCSKWLDCLTYVQDPTTNTKICYALGECNRLNDKNECANFMDTVGTSSVRQFDAKRDKDATGYSLINKYYFNQIKEVGFNSEVHYDFEDSVPALSCIRANSSQECSFTKNIVADSLVREPDNTPTDYPAHGKSYLKVPANYLISPHPAKRPISLLKDSTYYLNYLVNTKNSGLGAVVRIEESSTPAFNNSVTLSVATTTANNGWQRVVNKFTTGSVTPYIKIYLGTDDPNNRGYVYFDDINIEPVLQINSNEYLAKECRLYPTNESLTCLSKNNNVVSDGLEGYCLEHDLANPDVCLLWYPVDWIGSAKNYKSSLGYTGKFPLNYCTELNGNFDLVENRQGKRVRAGERSMQPLGEACDGKPCRDVCYYPNNQVKSDYNFCKNVLSWDGPESERIDKVELAKVNYFCGSDKYFVIRRNFSDVETAWCYPINIGNDYIRYLPSANTKSPSYDGGENGAYLVIEFQSNGWYRYDGLAKTAGEPCGDDKIICSIDESKNADPPVRVYDYNRPSSDEDNLKLITGSDPDKIFRLTCNRFTQVVDNNGENKAWTNRISANSAYATQTPAFFVSDSNVYYGASPNNLSRYGRNREDVPFGAAVWPDNFDLLSSEPITFRNQFSKKNNETIFAGRPYGCSNGSASKGCQSIGYCSLDPNVFCLLGNGTSTDYVSLKTCADGNYGTCYPIWSPNANYLNSTVAYDHILRTIFVKPYNAFAYNFNEQSYLPTASGIYEDYSATTTSVFEDPCDPESDRNFNDLRSFCAIYPKIKNLTLKFNNGTPTVGANPFYIPVKGVYKLEFNTIIDPEQQPLKEIRIDWGGNDPIQVITGQDHRPSTSTPHVFYHYYKSTGQKNIKVRVFDNWGKWGSCVACVETNGVQICPPPIE